MIGAWIEKIMRFGEIGQMIQEAHFLEFPIICSILTYWHRSKPPSVLIGSFDDWSLDRKDNEAWRNRTNDSGGSFFGISYHLMLYIDLWHRSKPPSVPIWSFDGCSLDRKDNEVCLNCFVE